MDVFLEDGYREQYNNCYDETLQLFDCRYQEQYIKTSYGMTYVLQIGDKSNPPLVLLHGMTMSSLMWYPNVKAWGQHYCIYAIDIVGDIGKSIAAEVVLEHEEAVAWLKETVDHLKLSHFNLAGHSIGGYIATCFTIAYQERVAKLALFAPAGIFHRLQMRFFYYAFPGMLFQTEKWIDRFFRNLSVKGIPFEHAYREFLLAGYHHAMPLLRLYPMKIEPEVLRELQLPILFMVGEQEVIYPAQQAIQYAQEHVPAITCQLVKGGNHLFTIEQAEIVNEGMLAFLAKVH